MESDSSSFGASLVGCLLLKEDGTIEAANETALLWLGYSSDEIVGRPVHTILGAGGQFFLQSQILPMLMLKGKLEEVYLRLKQRGGSQVPVLVNAGRVARGDRIGIEFCFIRILQRGHLEEELLQAKKLAEQGSDSKTKFLGMMSHELRTPLGAISLNNQLLIGGEFGALAPGQRELIASSEDCVRSVTVLIDDILNFAQMQGGPVQIAPQILQVAAALDRAELTIRHRLQNVAIKNLRGAVDVTMKARFDPDRLQQVLLNLLNNALKFTPKGGTISMGARQDGAWAVIDIVDTGCGIPPEQLSRIFEPFVQLHTTIETTEKKGVGLGLAICRDLAAAMGGSIRVASEVGKGSTFSILLPVA